MPVNKCSSKEERSAQSIALDWRNRSALCDQQRWKNIVTCHDIIHRFGVGRKRDYRLETAIAFPTLPNMMDLPLIPILGPFGGNQLTVASDAVRPEA
jgi:hypothetical protein